MLYLLSFLCLLLLFSVMAIFRNQRVFKEKMRVNKACYERAKKEELTVGEWEKIIDRYTYNEMMIRFWKPIKSFYQDIK